MSKLLENFANTTMNSISSGIGGSVGQQISYGLGELTGYNNKLKNDQIEQQEKLMELQMKGQKGMMDYQLSINNPKAQINRMKEAGLNPAMMYGQGGAGGGTVTQAGVDGGRAASETERAAIDIQKQGMGLQNAKLSSEIELLKSQAKLNNTEADKKAGADTDLINTNIENIIADTRNKGAQNKLISLQADYQEIINGVQKELSNLNIEKVKTEINYLNQDTERLMLSNYITNSSKEALIKTNILQNSKIAAEILKTNTQVNEINANIKLLESATELNKVKTIGESILNAINNIEKQNTEGSGMTKESGLLGPLVNGLRAGITGITNLLK